jgi:nucleoside-diphosphate-sugar epimerase
MHFYRGKRALVTGGLGFIGSNLAIRLVELGADVTIIDSQITGCGANPFNIRKVAPYVRLLNCDIGDTESVMPALRKADVVFNLAAEISHIHSMLYPERDLKINALAQLRFVEACAEAAPCVRIVYAGIRQTYGVPKYLPVDEHHPIAPIDFNGVHKFGAMMYHLILSRGGRLDAVALRLTNVYGPRMALNVCCQGFLSTFLRRLLLGQSMEIFGDGHYERDPLYVEDAINAFLLAGCVPTLASRIYNVGGREALTIGDIARIASRAARVGPPLARPFPSELLPIDIGSYRSDCRLIQNELAWAANVDFVDGISDTLSFFRSNLPHYVNSEEREVTCSLSERRPAVLAG